MFTVNELIAERDAVLVRSRQITEYVNSDEFYAPEVTEAERYHVKKQEKALLEYHANLIHQIELKTLPIQSS